MSLVNTAYSLRGVLEKFAEPIVLLLIRLYMFDVFFKSGKSKLDYWLNDDWDSAVQLFEDIHPVPFLPADIAAVLGTAGEVVLSCLLLVGLFGRLSALGLLVVTAMIEVSFHYVDDSYTTFESHYMWALLLGVIAVRGAGTLSLDRGLFRRKRGE